jgi:molybdate transport system substrate-binding protein
VLTTSSNRGRGWRRAGSIAIGLLAVATLVLTWRSLQEEDHPDPSPGPLQGAVVVRATTSLTAVLDELAAEFQLAHPGVDVQLVFGPSSSLASGLLTSTTADIFVPADMVEMDRLADADLVEGDPVVVATNRVSIIVAATNPRAVGGLGSLEASAWRSAPHRNRVGGRLPTRSRRLAWSCPTPTSWPASRRSSTPSPRGRRMRASPT